MASSPKKILVVEDEQETLVHLSNILKRSSYEVISTTKGSEAVGLVKSSSPDLVILDIVMPDMSGSEVAAALSEDPATAGIPIIYLTGILTKKEELSIKKTGRHFIMAKPTTGKEILEKVEQVLAAQKQ
ncbi:MAG: response regulator [Candidatus Omnitrophota bacterium]